LSDTPFANLTKKKEKRKIVPIAQFCQLNECRFRQKVKVRLLKGNEELDGIRDILPLFFNFGARWIANATPRPIYSR
jgi:hypothetical protein